MVLHFLFLDRHRRDPGMIFCPGCSADPQPACAAAQLARSAKHDRRRQQCACTSCSGRAFTRTPPQTKLSVHLVLPCSVFFLEQSVPEQLKCTSNFFAHHLKWHRECDSQQTDGVDANFLPRACLDSDFAHILSSFLNQGESDASHTGILTMFHGKKSE